MKGLLITGSNRGTGRSIAQAFHLAGYAISSLNRTAAGVPWLGETTCDLRDTDALETTCSAAIARLPSVDVCVLNAAIRHLHQVKDLSDQQWDESLRVNLTSVFQIAKRVLPELARTRGHLIIMGSQAANQFFEGGAAYCATKAAVGALSEVLLLEGRPLGVRTTLITPGAIRNRPKADDDRKIAPGTIGGTILQLVHLGTDAVISRVEIRPSFPLEAPVRGVDRLMWW